MLLLLLLLCATESKPQAAVMSETLPFNIDIAHAQTVLLRRFRPPMQVQRLHVHQCEFCPDSNGFFVPCEVNQYTICDNEFWRTAIVLRVRTQPASPFVQVKPCGVLTQSVMVLPDAEGVFHLYGIVVDRQRTSPIASILGQGVATVNNFIRIKPSPGTVVEYAHVVRLYQK